MTADNQPLSDENEEQVEYWLTDEARNEDRAAKLSMKAFVGEFVPLVLAMLGEDPGLRPTVINLCNTKLYENLTCPDDLTHVLDAVRLKFPGVYYGNLMRVIRRTKGASWDMNESEAFTGGAIADAFRERLGLSSDGYIGSPRTVDDVNLRLNNAYGTSFSAGALLPKEWTDEDRERYFSSGERFDPRVK